MENDFSSESAQINLEQSAQILVDTLSDEKDHPEIWEIIKISSWSKDGQLAQLTDYLQRLLSLSQQPKVAKLLTIIYAVCLGHLGNPFLAQNKLTDLLMEHQECRLVNGALSHVKQLINIS